MDLNKYISQKQSFEFYALDLSNNSYVKEIIELFEEVLLEPFLYEKDNFYIILCQTHNIEIENMINAINEDFGCNIKVFKSNLINKINIQYIDLLIDLYRKYSLIKPRSYTNISLLATDIMEVDEKELAILKPIVLDRIIKDNKLQEIINGMFVSNLNICKTADFVYMHRNTINNKLDLIYNETNLDIQKFNDAIIMYLLLRK